MDQVTCGLDAGSARIWDRLGIRLREETFSGREKKESEPLFVLINGIGGWIESVLATATDHTYSNIISRDHATKWNKISNKARYPAKSFYSSCLA
jgi:hypothetical protein